MSEYGQSQNFNVPLGCTCARSNAMKLLGLRARKLLLLLLLLLLCLLLRCYRLQLTPNGRLNSNVLYKKTQIPACNCYLCAGCTSLLSTCRRKGSFVCSLLRLFAGKPRPIGWPLSWGNDTPENRSPNVVAIAADSLDEFRKPGMLLQGTKGFVCANFK